MTTIYHHWPSVTFDSDGITLRRWLLLTVSIPWDEISFVSPTPIYELTDGIWSPSPTPDFLLVSAQGQTQHETDSGFLELRFVVSRTCVPMWMMFSLGSAYAIPLYGADDRPDPLRLVVSLDLHVARLSAPATVLFDLLAAHCRFDLLVTGE